MQLNTHLIELPRVNNWYLYWLKKKNTEKLTKHVATIFFQSV